MATIEERVAALEKLLAIAPGTEPFNSAHSGDQIDEAVGRALPGGALDTDKAPSGFGLGEVTAKELSDANRAVESGYYQCSQNVPAVGWWYLHCISHYDGSKTQYAFSVPAASGILAGTVCKRYMNDGTWGEWEYINPPMQLGVEYRTTERYLGKPVYVRAVDCGALPNTTSKTIGFGESGVAETISFVGVTSYGVVLTGSSENEHGCSLMVRLNGITLKTQTNQTGFTAIVTVKYIKNTD